MHKFLEFAEFLNRMVFMAADDGGAGSGTADPPAGDEGKNDEDADDKSAEGKDSKAQDDKSAAELAELKKKLKAEEAARKVVEKKLSDKEKEKLTEEEKAKAELDEQKAALAAEHRTLVLQSLGLKDEYLPLIAGSTAEEIKASGELIRKLVEKTKADTTAEVKKEIAKTGAPGARKDDDDTKEVGSRDFFASILKGGK